MSKETLPTSNIEALSTVEDSWSKMAKEVQPFKDNEGLKQAEDFYTDLVSLKDEPHFSEAVEIQNMVDWQSFPNIISLKLENESNALSEKTKQDIEQIQVFADYAKENSPEKTGIRDVGVDDRLLIGDKYNEIVLNFQKLSERKARIGEPKLSDEQKKIFCHELASIVNKYEDLKNNWRLVGERSLSDAFTAYADIKGTDSVVKDLSGEIPEKIDRYTILPLVSKINDVLREDWQHKITPIESYEEGSKYSLLCSRVKEPFSVQDSRNDIFSCSLLTDEHHETIGDDGKYGFVFPPDHIIAAAPYDTYTHNWSNDDEFSLRTGVPVVMSYDRVLKESQENKTYSEITTRDFPTGIFYIKDKIDEDVQKKLDELIKLNPGLPIVAL